MFFFCIQFLHCAWTKMKISSFISVFAEVWLWPFPFHYVLKYRFCQLLLVGLLSVTHHRYQQQVHQELVDIQRSVLVHGDEGNSALLHFSLAWPSRHKQDTSGYYRLLSSSLLLMQMVCYSFQVLFNVDGPGNSGEQSMTSCWMIWTIDAIMSLTFWSLVQTHTECDPLEPSNTHSFEQNSANFENPIFIVGCFSLKF